jgi:hypothetical protein
MAVEGSPRGREPVSDAEVETLIRERMLRDPEIRQRLTDGLERLRRGQTEGPLITRDELQALLRELD